MEQNSEIQVLFVGEDLRFYDRIKGQASLEYPELSFHYQTVSFSDSFLAKDLFIALNKAPVNIIYLDLTQDIEQNLYLAKLVSRNNEFRSISMVGLVSSQGVNTSKNIRSALHAGLKLVHYKGLEIFELIYDPISLLDVDKAHSRELIVGKHMGEVEILQPLRVSYIEGNHFRIETNSYLKEGEIMEVDNHPLIDIMPSKKLFVDKFTGRDLYYNRRFSYDLEFIYIDNDFFSSSNSNWLIYKKLKSSPDSVKEIEQSVQNDVISDMERRKKAFDPIKQSIDKWIADRSLLSVPKILKIMVIDHTLDIFSQISGRIENFPFSLNFQTKVMDDGYQIKRSTPHLIIFNFDERENSFKEFEIVLNKIKILAHYHPAIVVSNFPFDHEPFIKKYKYNNLIVYGEDIKLDDISKMANILDKKKRVTVNSNRVYPKSKDPHSFISMRRKVSIISASEIILYLQSDTEMPVGTVFEMKDPLKLLLTVVPFKEGERRPEGENIYRALIHGISEREREGLRRLINKSLKLEKVE